VKSFAIPLCCLLAGCAGKMPTLADIGFASTPKAKPVAGYLVDRPKPVMTDLPGRASPVLPSVTAYQPSVSSTGPLAVPVALAAPPVPPPSPGQMTAITPVTASTTPLSSEPQAAEPPSAAPLPLAASPGQGQGEGLPEPPPPPPVTRTLPLAEALRLLATKAGVTSDVQIAGSPTVEVTGDPSGNLAADLAALMVSVRPAHYAAIGIDRKGTPIRLFISPYPIVGAGQ
jgi:hypothetical protein